MGPEGVLLSVSVIFVISFSDLRNIIFFPHLLKEQSRPSISKLTSTDVSLTTTLDRRQSCNVISQRYKIV